MMATDNDLSPAQDLDIAVVQGGAAYFNDLERRLAPYFERAKPRQRAMASRRGLLSPAERKNSWQLAEVRGDATPYGFQHVLRRAPWEPEAVRDELRRYVLQQLGDREAVLVLDETGFLKKGRTRPVWRGHRVGPRGGSSIARVGSCWATPVPWARPCWIANALCPRSGPRTAPAAGGRAFRTRAGLRPNRSWPSRWGRGPSPPGYPPGG